MYKYRFVQITSLPISPHILQETVGLGELSNVYPTPTEGSKSFQSPDFLVSNAAQQRGNNSREAVATSKMIGSGHDIELLR